MHQTKHKLAAMIAMPIVSLLALGISATPAQAGIGMDAIVIRGCTSQGGTAYLGRDGNWYCRL